MSITKDKSVPTTDARPRKRRRRKTRYVSDDYSEMEVEALIGGRGMPPRAWEANLGRRLELAVHKLGRDNSVQLLGLSWKQLQRYFAGDSTVGAATLSALATATRLSVTYLVDGRIITAGDTELERMVLDRKIDAVDRIFDASTDESHRRRLTDFRMVLLRRSTELFVQLARSMLEEDISLKAKEELRAFIIAYEKSEQNHGGLPPVPTLALELGTSAQVREAPPATQKVWAVDEELLARISEGVAKAYKEANARLSPADQGRTAARIMNELIAAYDDPAERLVGLKLALERLRADLREVPVSGESSGKRSA